MSGRDALQLAQERHLDLVEIAPTAKPPVCRIMDYGKYRYEQQKRDKEARKKQKTFDIKEVKLRPGIEDHTSASNSKCSAIPGRRRQSKSHHHVPWPRIIAS